MNKNTGTVSASDGRSPSSANSRRTGNSITLEGATFENENYYGYDSDKDYKDGYRDAEYDYWDDD